MPTSTELIQLTLTPVEARMLCEHFAASCMAMQGYVSTEPDRRLTAVLAIEKLVSVEAGQPGNNDTGMEVSRKIAMVMDRLEELGMKNRLGVGNVNQEKFSEFRR